jgi:large subunit ribosomal protein L12
MEYIYASLILHKAGKEINEQNVKKILEAAGVHVDENKVKAVVAALHGVDIEQAIKESLTVAPVSEKKETKKEEKKEEKKDDTAAAAGLASLFG